MLPNLDFCFASSPVVSLIEVSFCPTLHLLGQKAIKSMQKQVKKIQKCPLIPRIGQT
jgi:hypothetical protein